MTASSVPACNTGYINATLITMRLVSRTIWDDHNGVLQVLANSMQMEFGAAGCLPWISLNQEVDGFGRSREDHLLFLWSKEIQYMRFWPDPSIPCVLHLEVGIHIFCGQIRSILPNHQPLTLLDIVSVYLAI